MKIAVIGTGMIGRAWAISFARAGHDVVLQNRNRAGADAARASILERLPELEESGLLNGAAASAVAEAISVVDTIAEATADADYVQENVAEKLEVKRELFKALDDHARPNTILASSTSAIVPSAFTDHLAHPERCLVVHPLNPPYLIPAVDVVPSPWTSPDVMDRVCALLVSCGQAPIRMDKEDPGFLTIRLQGALYHEAFRLVAAGLASAEAVDVCIRDGLGLRWSFMGPFETGDLNAPGGIRDFVGRYGKSYEDMYPRGGPFSWTGEVLDQVEAARRAQLPMEDHPDRQHWRDRRLIALMAHKRREDVQDQQAEEGSGS